MHWPTPRVLSKLHDRAWSLHFHTQWIHCLLMLLHDSCYMTVFTSRSNLIVDLKLFKESKRVDATDLQLNRQYMLCECSASSLTIYCGNDLWSTVCQLQRHGCMKIDISGRASYRFGETWSLARWKDFVAGGCHSAACSFCKPHYKPSSSWKSSNWLIIIMLCPCNLGLESHAPAQQAGKKHGWRCGLDRLAENHLHGL